jgi:DNA processing protein
MNYTHEWICCLWLALMLPDCSPRYMQLVEEYGAAVTVFENFEDVHKENPSLIRQVELERMRKTSPEQLFHRFENTLQKLKVDVIFLNSDEYPSILKQISSPPNVLFVRGKMPNEEALTVGIVGSRKCTSYGVEATRNIAYSLAEGGACIVSGLAEGIDAHASSAALECKSNSCPTVAVLGSGIDVVFPKCNESLYHAIIERGAVISQFCPNAQPASYTFPKRNKVIAGLSRCLIVSEAAKDSGALITADYAGKFGRKVFCIPGRITDWQSEGSNTLINSKKATLLLSIEQVIDECKKDSFENLQYNNIRSNKPKEKTQKTPAISKPAKPKIELDEKSMTIYNALLDGEKTFDELCIITGLSVPELNLSLTTMEFSRIIKQSQGRAYSIFCDI